MWLYRSFYCLSWICWCFGCHQNQERKPHLESQFSCPFLCFFWLWMNACPGHLTQYPCWVSIWHRLKNTSGIAEYFQIKQFNSTAATYCLIKVAVWCFSYKILNLYFSAIYLSAVMATTSLSLFVTVLVLHFHHKTYCRPVPRWLLRVLCIRTESSKRNPVYGVGLKLGKVI